MSIEAMKQALEALANSRDYIYLSPTGDCTWSEQDQLSELKEAITALRQAIEQAQKQEPTYTSTQATNCAGCGQHKHTPLRIDAMGGYVCLTCIDKKLGSLLGEFGYEQPEHSPDCALLKIPARDCDCQAEQEPVADREAFERHWKKVRGAKKSDRELKRHPLQPQTYIQDSANRHWVTWQAATRKSAHGIKGEA